MNPPQSHIVSNTTISSGLRVTLSHGPQVGFFQFCRKWLSTELEEINHIVDRKLSIKLTSEMILALKKQLRGHVYRLCLKTSSFCINRPPVTVVASETLLFLSLNLDPYESFN